MSKFFIPKENIKEDTITITGGDVAHISRVLRMGRGRYAYLVQRKRHGL